MTPRGRPSAIEEAVTHCHAGIRVYEALPEPRPGPLVDVYTSLAVAEASLGHVDEARTALELADAIIDSPADLTNHHQVLGRHHFEHAKLLWVWGEHARARALANQSIDRYAVAGANYQRHLDEVRTWLAARAD